MTQITFVSASARKMPVDNSPWAKLQRIIRDKSNARLHCSRLADRLMLESSIVRGTFRLINQTLIFTLMLIALKLSGDPAVKRGIYTDLKASFDFESLTESDSRGAWVDALPAISQASKRYFILSSQYFSEEGNLELLGPLQEFSSPTLLGGIEPAITLPHISFSAWLRVTPQFSKGYLLRKRLVAAGDGAELACWGWYFDKRKGPQLHFGVHDFFPTDRDVSSSKGHLELSLAGAVAGAAEQVGVVAEEFALMSMLVSETHVTFYRNLDRLGAVEMPRPLTDCFNDWEGLLVGGAGMSISQLRFYPRLLSESDIEEIYHFGARLADMATGSLPQRAAEEALARVERSLQSAVGQVLSAVGKQEQQGQLTATAQMAQEASAGRMRLSAPGHASPPMAAGETPAAESETMDVSIGRAYVQIVGGAVRLTDWRTTGGAERLVSRMPSFRGTGMTLTWWYRHMPCPSPTAQCGLYLFHSGDFSGAPGANRWCWTLWIENKAIWYDAGGGGYTYFERDMGIESKFLPSSDWFWRHMAMQMDEEADVIRFYLDGVLAAERKWDVEGYGRISEADCDTTGGVKRLSLGHSKDGWNNAAEVEVADIRMYVHGQDGGRLTDSDLASVAAQPIPMAPAPNTTEFVSKKFQCLPVTSPELADSTWVDAHGNDCEWYFNHKSTRPEICQLSAPAANCPKSCESRLECLAHTDLTRRAAAAAAAAGSEASGGSGSEEVFRDTPCVRGTIAFEDSSATAQLLRPVDNQSSSTTLVLAAALSNLGRGGYIKTASGEYMKVDDIADDGVTLSVQRAAHPPGLLFSPIAAAPNGSAITLAGGGIDARAASTLVKLAQAIASLDVGEYLKSPRGEYMKVTGVADAGTTLTVERGTAPRGLLGKEIAAVAAGSAVTIAEAGPPPPVDTGTYPTYFTWDRTELINMRSEKGTMCLAKGSTRKSVVEDCRAWMARNANGGEGALGGRGLGAAGQHTGVLSHPDDDFIAGWLESMGVAGQGFKFRPTGVPQPRAGRRLNLTVCEELAEAVDEHCSFDIEPIRRFTQDLKDNGGDWTIAFWVRADPGNLEQSKMGDSGRFFPHLSFFASISPPQHAITIGKWINPNGEIRINSKCVRHGARDLFWNVEHRSVSNTDWTFIAVTTSNSTDPMEMHTMTNLGVNSETESRCAGGHPNCLFDDQYLFRGIEINYPMLISPIMMVPRRLPFATLQEEYLRRARDMRIKIGPLNSNAERKKARVPVDKHDYTSRSTLMATPIIFQTRANVTTKCPFQYSTEWISKQHRKAVEQKCTAPFECDKNVLENNHSVIACKDDAAGDGGGIYFGLPPQKFKGETGYADFLYTIADNDFVFRGDGDGAGDLSATDAFIDSLTEAVKVVLVFFTPSKGVVTILELAADFSGFKSVQGSVSVDHYAILEGPNLSFYLAVQSAVLVNLAIMLCDVFRSIQNAVNERRTLGAFPWTRIIEPFIDLSCACLVLVYVILKIPGKMKSARETASILGALDHIPWSSPDVPLVSKKEEFFHNVMALIGHIEEEKMMNSLCYAILLVNLLRVIQCTSVHPRLALLTGTLANAADDLWHTAILTSVLMLCFAGIGQWRFGNTREDFGDFETALRTEFQMLFGEFPEGWGDDPALQRELQVFVVLYLLVLFVLVLNFLLAIIVEAYMKLRALLDEIETEQEFLTDVGQSFWARMMGVWHGWPAPRLLSSDLSALSGKNSVGFRDLYATGLFRSPSSIRSFLRYYSGYAFIGPRAVTRYGVHPTQSHVWSAVLGSADTTVKQDLAMLGAIIDRKICLSAGRDVPTLQQELEQSLRTVVERRRGAGREDSARAVEAMLASQTVASALRPGITQSSKVGEKHKDKPVEELKEEAGASLAHMQSQRGSMDPTSSCPGPNRFGTDESAALGGLGFTYKRRDDGLFRVCKVKRGGFASRSGLMQENDVVHSVDGVACQTLGTLAFTELLSGPVGSKCWLGLSRQGDAEVRAVECTRMALATTPPAAASTEHCDDEGAQSKEMPRTDSPGLSTERSASWGGMSAGMVGMLPAMPKLDFEMPQMKVPFYVEISSKPSQSAPSGP